MKFATILESRRAKKELSKAPKEIVKAYEIWASLIETHGTRILGKFSGYNDEKLSGTWQCYRSSRLSKQWRVIYSKANDDGIEIVTVERVTPHDYRKR